MTTKKFPPDLFSNLTNTYALAELIKLQAENSHLKNVVKGFKGWRTKRKK